MAELVTAPARTARVGGVKSVIPFVDEPRLTVSLGSGGLVWEDSGCDPSVHFHRAGCYDDSGAPTGAKTPEGITAYTTLDDPFLLYKGVECFIGGDSEGDSYETQATANLEAVESIGIEKWISTRLGTPVAVAGDVKRAIAYLERDARAKYLYRPIIWLAVDDATMAAAAGMIEEKDGALQTKLGTPVIASAEFDDGFAAVTGAAAVYVSPVRAYLGLQKTDNLAMAIAERAYAVGIDCGYRQAITFTP